MSEIQDIRRRVLQAVIDSDGDPEDGEVENQIAENRGLIPRYAIVSEYGPTFDGTSYSIDLTDTPDERLKELGESFPSHGYRAFCLVDLGDGSAKDVGTLFIAGEPTSEPSHDFTHVLSSQR